MLGKIKYLKTELPNHLKRKRDEGRPVGRPRHDAPPVQQHGNAIDLQRRRIRKALPIVDAARRTLFEWPFSVNTHLPVATSHTLSVLSHDPDTTCCPSGNNATHSTYNEDTSSQKVLQKSDAARRTQLRTSSVATHSPVSTSHTLSVLSCPPADTTRRPPENTATPWTYDEDRSS